jgi:hypothetical protein
MGVRVPADLEMVGMPLQSRHPTFLFYHPTCTLTISPANQLNSSSKSAMDRWGQTVVSGY